MALSLLPDNPGAWTYRRFEDLYAIPREERETLQLEAVRINFARMRNRACHRDDGRALGASAQDAGDDHDKPGQDRTTTE